MDGDVPQVNAILSQLSLIGSKHLDVLKFSANCSANEQPNDMSQMHPALKAKGRVAVVAESNQPLDASISDKNSVFVAKAIAKALQKNTKLSSTARKLFKELVAYFPSFLKLISPRLVQEGWQRAGMAYTKDGKQFDLDRIMANCKRWQTTQVTEEVKAQIMAAIPDLKAVALRKGTVENNDLARCKVPYDPRQRSVRLSSQRAAWITHEKMRDWLHQLKEAKQEKEEKEKSAKKAKVEAKKQATKRKQAKSRSRQRKARREIQMLRRRADEAKSRVKQEEKKAKEARARRVTEEKALKNVQKKVLKRSRQEAQKSRKRRKTTQSKKKAQKRKNDNPSVGARKRKKGVWVCSKCNLTQIEAKMTKRQRSGWHEYQQQRFCKNCKASSR